MLPLTQDVPDEPTLSSGFAPLLSESHPRYVGAMRDGAVFVLFALAVNILASIGLFIAGLLMGVSTPFMGAPSSDTFALIDMIHAVVVLVASAAGVIGWWWLTTRDPQEREHGVPSRSRSLARTTLVVQTLAFIGMTAGPIAIGFLIPDNPSEAQTRQIAGALALVSLVFLFSMLVKFFATMTYLRWLAPRIPDETLEEKAASFMWVGPFLVIAPSIVTVLVALTGMPLLFIGFTLVTVVCAIAAVVMYWNLIFKTYAGLSEIAQEQRDKAQLAAAARHNAAA